MLDWLGDKLVQEILDRAGSVFRFELDFNLIQRLYVVDLRNYAGAVSSMRFTATNEVQNVQLQSYSFDSETATGARKLALKSVVFTSDQSLLDFT